MKNELFTIGPLTVYGYGVMIAVGIFAGYGLCDYRAKKCRLDRDQLFYLVLVSVLGGFLGSKLLYWMTEWRSLLQDPGRILNLGDGFVVYGGLLGGILAGYLYCRHRELSFWAYADLILPSMALAQGFGRIGCLLAGCCYGRETESPFHLVFQDSAFAPNGVPLIPTQIYSSLLDFLHCGILLFLSGRKKEDGQVTGWYLIFYSIGRFVLEFFRGDLERGSVGALSTSQFIALFTLAAGVFILLGRRNTAKNRV